MKNEQSHTSPPTSPITKILDKHGVVHSLKGTKNSSFKTMAEDLLAELENERQRSQVVQSNLNGLLNQYQVTAQSHKALQASYEDLTRKYKQRLLEMKAETNGDDTDTEGE